MIETEQTEFKYTELSDAAKATARLHYVYRGYPWDEWWEPVYEEMAKVCELFGIDLNPGSLRFSGFGSQGDGARFTGIYDFVGPVGPRIREYAPNDELLHALADQLDALQVGHKLQHDATLRATIYANGFYSHSGCMYLAGIRYERNGGSCYLDDLEVSESDEVALLAVMRGLADWHYQQLQAEYDHLTSDEEIDMILGEQDGTLYTAIGDTI